MTEIELVAFYLFGALNGFMLGLAVAFGTGWHRGRH